MKHLPHVILAFVALAVMAAFAGRSIAISGFLQFGYPDQQWLGVLSTSQVIAIVLGIATFITLIRVRRIMTYADEVVDELLKVTWPTRDDTVRAAVTVVASTFFMAFLLGGYDIAWKHITDFVFNLFS